MRQTQSLSDCLSRLADDSAVICCSHHLRWMTLNVVFQRKGHFLIFKYIVTQSVNGWHIEYNLLSLQEIVLWRKGDIVRKSMSHQAAIASQRFEGSSQPKEVVEPEQ